MISSIRRYTRWLHTRWPAGTVEKLPRVNEDGSTNVAGVYIVGDLTGIPLLKFSVDSGARAVSAILADSTFERARGQKSPDTRDLVIIGAGVSGFAAAKEAQAHGLDYTLLEASEPFSTIVNFPRQKPIYTYPTEMDPAGDLEVSAEVKEALLEELEGQTLDVGISPQVARATRIRRVGGNLEVELAEGGPLRALRVIVAIGRSGNFRKLNVPGEERDKVYNRLHDPQDFCGQRVLVVGGGDSALETAIALTQCGAHVTLSYRKPEFSRPKPENAETIRTLSHDPSAQVAVESPSSERVTTSTGDFIRHDKAPGSLTLMMSSQVLEIADETVRVRDADGNPVELKNQAVFRMIGREAPLDFFRRSGIEIAGEMTGRNWLAFGVFFAFCVFVYHWKSDTYVLPIKHWFQERGWFPFNIPAVLAGFGSAAETRGHLLHVLSKASADPGTYYTLAYCVLVVVFGIKRMRRRKTPYVRAQTLALMAFQCIPLFLLPVIVLPWMGENGWFANGTLGGRIADQFFEPYDEGGLDRAYWRAYGFVLAWPLFVWNWFTEQPLWGWLIVGLLQTAVLIPLLIYYFGKGAYCGWICSCGALAETLGDAHRHKMPHGPLWNRLNMTGQVVLWVAVLLMIVRILGWIWPDSGFGWFFEAALSGKNGLRALNYKWTVDVFLAGVLGVACYFWFSGRVWCRFACPLAALMHIYARFSRFRILADKKKCISCNVCTSVCHQGIDVMNFANKGLPMEDPECVRCSACVQSCPTGVLSFGQVDPRTGTVLRKDRLAASLVQLTEQGRARE